MAFINEEISKEDSVKVNWEQFPEYQQRPEHKHLIELPLRWTIDRTRGVFLWDIERPSPEIQFYKFGLYWKDQLIYMNANLQLKEYPKTEHRLMDVFWCVFNISIPKAIGSDRVTILNLIKEAFEAHGYYYCILGPCGEVSVSIR